MSIRTSRCFPLSVVLVWATVLPVLGAEATGISKLVAYRSPVDDSLQEYGVYIPPGDPPPGGYPCVLHTHGYGWWVGTGFSRWQTDWADAHRWILVQLNARGPQFYWGIGDVATREVIDDLWRRFGIDRTRVYITGSSMGGTGAHRQGVMNPELIASAVGVDGWTDFREWHWHWYARKDQRDDIEEFRRPLLEAASPLYMAERAMWGDVYVIADALDDIVLPQQGVDLARRLEELKQAEPGLYDGGLTHHLGLGHGGGYDLAWIYDYFLGKAARPERGSFRIATTVLDHGEMYWGRMDRLHIQGLKALLDCACDEAEEMVTVTTSNLDSFTLYLRMSPLADRDWLRVYVDGIRAYVGPPGEVIFESIRDAEDRLVDWQGTRVEDADPDSLDRSPGWRKTRELCGPVGHAFLQPFVVCYGTVGPQDLQRRHREEAQAFAAGWNDFMIHGPGVVAVPEDEVPALAIQRKTLVVYGTLASSRLLQQAQALRPLPVQVRADEIVVRDPLTGDRHYRGTKYGAFAVSPNPLSGGRTYLVICSGRFASRPDGGEPRGLEYDLEKLCWAYPDMVIFNTDIRDLPHVMNVNNKPAVTCYEAGYFVEAGYHDMDWLPDRLVTLERVRAAPPARLRLIHVADVRVERTTQGAPVVGNVDGEPSDPPRPTLTTPAWLATVRVVDASGLPVRQARVTGQWLDCEADSLSRPTLSNGEAYFPAPQAWHGTDAPRFRVLGVMATGCEHDFEADCLRGSAWESPDGTLAVRASPLRQRVDRELVVPVRVQVANLTTEPRSIVAGLVPPCGMVVQEDTPQLVAPGQTVWRTVRWQPDPTAPAGLVLGTVFATDGRSRAESAVQFVLPRARPYPVRLTSAAGKDILCGEPYEIKAQVRNLHETQAVTLPVTCTILPGRHLPPRQVQVPPGQVVEVVWRPTQGEEALPRGEYKARVTVPGFSLSEVAEFTVR